MKFLKWCAIILLIAMACAGICSMTGKFENIEFPWDKEQEAESPGNEDNLSGNEDESPSVTEDESLRYKWTKLEKNDTVDYSVFSDYVDSCTYGSYEEIGYYDNLPIGSIIMVTFDSIVDDDSFVGEEGINALFGDYYIEDETSELDTTVDHFFKNGDFFVIEKDQCYVYIDKAQIFDFDLYNIEVWLLEIENANDGKAKVATFNVAGTEYEYEYGMTIEQWVNSKYNVDGYILQSFYLFNMEKTRVGQIIRDRMILPEIVVTLDTSCSVLEFEGTEYIVMDGITWENWTSYFCNGAFECGYDYDLGNCVVSRDGVYKICRVDNDGSVGSNDVRLEEYIDLDTYTYFVEMVS